MSRRSPSEFHNYWGIAANANALPNAPGNIVVDGPLNLQEGDLAFVSGESTLYLCTSPGTVNNGGDAVWAPLYSGSDHFAPKYVVGSQGDSQVSFNVGGFFYFPDDGTGNGIKAAIEAATVEVGDIYIRSGLYDLSGYSASGELPFNLPVGCKISGSGNTTQIVCSLAPGGIATIFSLFSGCELSNLRIDLDDTLGTAGSGTSVVDVVSDDRAYCSKLTISVLKNPTSTSTVYQCLYASGSGLVLLENCVFNIVGPTTVSPDPDFSGLAAVRCLARLTAYRCDFWSTDFGIVGTYTQQNILVDQCTIVSGYCGVYAKGDLNITGATSIAVNDPTKAVFGVILDRGFNPCNLIINGARISAINLVPAASIGVSSTADTGQIVSSTVTGPTGIDTSAGLGAGHTIGFNVITASAGQEIVSALMDEVAHNIFA